MGLLDKLLETGLKAVDTVGTMKDGVKRDMAIKELERKKKASQNMIQKDIDEIQTEIYKRYAELGMLIYELCLDGRITNNRFNKAVDVEFIVNLKKLIDDNNTEILEIGYRYDSEIAAISGNPQGISLGVGAHPTSDEKSHVLKMLESGQITSSEATKLMNNIEGSNQENNVSRVQEAQYVRIDESVGDKPLVCKECQEPYIEGESMFCDSCGSRL